MTGPAPGDGGDAPAAGTADPTADPTAPDPAAVVPVKPAGDVAQLREQVLAPMSAPPAAAAHRGAGAWTWLIVRQLWLPTLLVASIVFYSTWSKTSAAFWSTANWQNMAASQAVIGVLTLGGLLVLVSANFDLSIGNICGLSSVMTAAAYSHLHVPLVVGLLIGVGLGAAIGGLNGLLTTTLHVDPFIITLGTASIIIGVTDWYTHGQSIITGIPQSLVTFGHATLLGIPNVAWVLAAVALAIYFLLEHTPYGRALHAIGSNRAAAKLVGVRVDRSIALAFVLTGAFAGAAGVLLLAHTGSGNPAIGTTFTLTALAAAFLGAVSFNVGRFNVPGTLVAIYFLAVNITGLTFANVESWINQVFTGASLVLGVALAAVLSVGRNKRTRPPPSTEQTRNPA